MTRTFSARGTRFFTAAALYCWAKRTFNTDIPAVIHFVVIKTGSWSIHQIRLIGAMSRILKEEKPNQLDFLKNDAFLYQAVEF